MILFFQFKCTLEYFMMTYLNMMITIAIEFFCYGLYHSVHNSLKAAHVVMVYFSKVKQEGRHILEYKEETITWHLYILFCMLVLKYIWTLTTQSILIMYSLCLLKQTLDFFPLTFKSLKNSYLKLTPYLC